MLGRRHFILKKPVRRSHLGGCLDSRFFGGEEGAKEKEKTEGPAFTLPLCSYWKLPEKGFTLLELQVGIVLLLFAVGGLAAVMANYLRQVEQMEAQQSLYTVISPDRTKVIFTECMQTNQSQRVYLLSVTSLQLDGENLDAQVTLKANLNANQ